MLIAQNLKEMQVSGLDTARFTQAVTAMLNGETTEMTLGEAQMTVQKFLQEREAEAGRAAREAGEKFLAENGSLKRDRYRNTSRAGLSDSHQPEVSVLLLTVSLCVLVLAGCRSWEGGRVGVGRERVRRDRG